MAEQEQKGASSFEDTDKDTKNKDLGEDREHLAEVGKKDKEGDMKSQSNPTGNTQGSGYNPSGKTDTSGEGKLADKDFPKGQNK